MVYEGWSIDVEMLIGDEWYLWEDFVHFVKYRLGQLSFTYDRRSIRQHLDLPRSLVNIVSFMCVKYSVKFVFLNYIAASNSSAIPE